MTGEYNPAGDAPTLVIHADHDAADTGLVFHPGGPKLIARLAGGLIEYAGGIPAPMSGAAAGATAVAVGQLFEIRRLRRLGTAISAGYALAMIDIWKKPGGAGGEGQPLERRRDAGDPRCPRSHAAPAASSDAAQHGPEESVLKAMVRFGDRNLAGPQASVDHTSLPGGHRLAAADAALRAKVSCG